MKVFLSKDGYKTNFADDNNMLVGFDSYQCCCENFGWFFSSIKEDQPGTINNLSPDSMDGFNFVNEKPARGCFTGYDYGGDSATFRLNNGGIQAYLTIYNHHNGYYSHGFTFVDGDTEVCEGYL